MLTSLKKLHYTNSSNKPNLWHVSDLVLDNQIKGKPRVLAAKSATFWKASKNEDNAAIVDLKHIYRLIFI